MYRIIAGGTGLIGRHLVQHWLGQNHRIIVVGRTQEKIQKLFGNRVEALTWNHFSRDVLQSAEIIVNLAGANVGAKRFTAKRKREILESRVFTTQKIVNLITQLGTKSPPFFNASAVGIYGLQQQSQEGLPPTIDEYADIAWDHAPDFLAYVAREWEKTAAKADRFARVVFLRFGVVLAKEGGALPKIAKPFQYHLGGPVGTGRQPFSWVAIDDVIRAIDFLFEKSAEGPFNLVSPQCVSQRTLAKTLGKVLDRPASFPMPAFLLKLMLGSEMAEDLLLEGQHSYPTRLLQLGFKFKYQDIKSALEHIYQK